MKASIVIAVFLGCMALAAHADDLEEAPPPELLTTQVCARARVDSSTPEAQLSRSERRARKRCTEAAQRMAGASGDADEQDDEGVICRRESVLGTHRRIRICTTQAQRDAMRAASAEVIRDITRARGNPGPEGQ